MCGVLSADKTLLISMQCFSRVLISNVHKSIIIVINSIDTRFSRNVFEAIQKTCSTCFIRSKTTRLCLMVLNPIKHSCSFFKPYVRAIFQVFAGCSLYILSTEGTKGTQCSNIIFWKPGKNGRCKNLNWKSDIF